MWEISTTKSKGQSRSEWNLTLIVSLLGSERIVSPGTYLLIRSVRRVLCPSNNCIPIARWKLEIVEHEAGGKIVQQVRTPADGSGDVRRKIHGGIECDHIRLKRHLTLIDEVKVDVSEELNWGIWDWAEACRWFLSPWAPVVYISIVMSKVVSSIDNATLHRSSSLAMDLCVCGRYTRSPL